MRRKKGEGRRRREGSMWEVGGLQEVDGEGGQRGVDFHKGDFEIRGIASMA